MRKIQKEHCRLENFGLSENKDKRITKCEKIKFLRYELFKNKIRPIQERSKGVQDYCES